MRADIPIGKIIERHHIEARREILTARVTPDETGGIFPVCKNEPLLSRQYRIIHGGEPLIFIEEQFPFNQFLDKRRVIVRTPSRIHLTLLDMNGGLGRVDGGVGIALEDPAVLLEAQANDSLEVCCGDVQTAALVRKCAEHVLTAIHAGGSVSITVRGIFPGSPGPWERFPARACHCPGLLRIVRQNPVHGRTCPDGRARRNFRYRYGRIRPWGFYR